MENGDKLFYNACTECRRKLYEQAEGWRCESCAKYLSSPQPTFMFQARFTDLSGEVYINFARDQAETLLGITAQEYKDMLEEEGGLQKVKDHVQ